MCLCCFKCPKSSQKKRLANSATRPRIGGCRTASWRPSWRLSEEDRGKEWRQQAPSTRRTSSSRGPVCRYGRVCKRSGVAAQQPRDGPKAYLQSCDRQRRAHDNHAVVGKELTDLWEAAGKHLGTFQRRDQGLKMLNPSIFLCLDHVYGPTDSAAAGSQMVPLPRQHCAGYCWWLSP